MLRRLLLPFTVLLVMFASISATLDRADACCMIPSNYTGKVGQAEQRALLIHRDGVEDLILGITYQITPDAEGNMPEKLTWLIALPSEPMEENGYGLAETDLFDSLGEFAIEKLIKKLPPSRGPKKNSLGDREEAPAELANDGVELGRAVSVGPYDIQPVRGVGQNALDGLNGYLKKRGFPTEDPAHMAWFVEHGFTFLCIEVTPKEGQKTLSAGEPMPPLRVRFNTEHPYYPLRYSSQQGDFSLALYTLTEKPIDLEKSAGVLDAINWSNRPTYRASGVHGVWKKPQTVRSKELLAFGEVAKTLPKESRALIGVRKDWSFALLEGRPNHPNEQKSISDWTGDFFLTLEGEDTSPLATGNDDADDEKS